MWLNPIYDHKILDIAKNSKNPPVFGQKSVDKRPVGLVYYWSTHLEKILPGKILRPSQKNSGKGLTMKERCAKIPKFADEAVRRGDGRYAGNGVYLVN